MGEKKIEVIHKRSTVRSTNIESNPDVTKKEILDFLQSSLENLLGSPQDLKLSIEEGDRTTIFEIDIAQSDFGRLIGSKGRTIGAIRTLVSAMAAIHNIRAIVRIKDEERFF